MDLQAQIEEKIRELDISVKQLRTSGSNYAKSYSDYRMELSKELLRLKDEGMPVTIAYDVARGKPSIAKLKFNEIKDEAIYKANIESINAIKLQIKILAEQINREWSNINEN